MEVLVNCKWCKSLIGITEEDYNRLAKYRKPFVCFKCEKRHAKELNKERMK